MKKTLILVSLLIVFASSAFSHIPFFLTPEDFVEGSYLVKEIDLSQIYYYIFSSAEKIRFVFEGTAGQQFHMLFGVPKEADNMKSTADFRPNLTFYGPDREVLEDFFLESTEPEIMYEFFGDTYSYLYVRHDSELTKEGIYSVEIEAEGSGRAWITFGKKERFTVAQIAAVPRWIREMRAFHYHTGLAKWEKYGLGIVGIIGTTLITLVFF